MEYQNDKHIKLRQIYEELFELAEKGKDAEIDVNKDTLFEGIFNFDREEWVDRVLAAREESLAKAYEAWTSIGPAQQIANSIKKQREDMDAEKSRQAGAGNAGGEEREGQTT